MAILDAVKNLVSIFETTNYSELPQGIRRGVEKYLKAEESILVTLLDWRAIYRAPRWLDSNTYFNSWFILTNYRIIIARNSSVFKRFRDIPLAGITQIYFDLDSSEPKITINSPGQEDIIEFLRKASGYCANLEHTLNEAIGNARNTHKSTADGEFMYCGKCGSKILRGSHFCSECGVSLDSPF